MFNHFIRNLQQKSYTARVRILWTTVATIGVILLLIWSTSLKSTLNNNKTENNNNQITDLGTIVKNKYITVERAETTGDLITIYFKASNQDADILNFSKLENIKLVADNTELTPIKMLDRQNNAFVQKILSKTENYGMLQFSSKTFDHGVLTFSDLFFESQPQNIFQEQAEFELAKILKNQEIRN
jgi:hypothetical protein